MTQKPAFAQTSFMTLLARPLVSTQLRRLTILPARAHVRAKGRNTERLLMSRVRLIVFVAAWIAISSIADAQAPVKTARRAAPVVRPTERRVVPDEPAASNAPRRERIEQANAT